MKRTIAIIGPPERWTPHCRSRKLLANLICVSPLRTVPKDDASFSLFLIDLFSGKYDVLVATCSTAIDSMVTMAKSRNMLDRLKEATTKVELIAIGERTSAAAKRNGLKVCSEASEPTTGALLELINARSVHGTVALLRSDQGSPVLADGLERSGWKVEDVPVYSVLLDESEDMASLLDRIEGGSVDALVFPTPAHVQAFMVQLQGRCGEDDVLSLVLGLQVAAMGPETKECLEGYGVKVVLVPSKATPERMLDELLHDD
jgi:uroporphyrinogen-III synthase